LLPSESNSVTIGAKFFKTKQGLFFAVIKKCFTFVGRNLKLKKGGLKGAKERL
jgi:hypothetical protein